MALPKVRAVPDIPRVSSTEIDGLGILVKQLIEALNQPMLRPEITMPVDVSVNPHVPPSVVHVAAAEVHIPAQPRPEVFVEVEAPNVNVSPAEVTVSPQVTLSWAPKSATTTVKRGSDGLIETTTTRYEY